MTRAIRRIILTEHAPVLGRHAGADFYCNNIAYDWALSKFGGVELSSVEIRAGAKYDPKALEFLLSRVRKQNHGEA